MIFNNVQPHDEFFGLAGLLKRKLGGRKRETFHTRRPKSMPWRRKLPVHAELINKNDSSQYEGDDIQYEHLFGFGKKAKEKRKERQAFRKEKRSLRLEKKKAKIYSMKTLADKGIQYKSGLASVAEGLGGLLGKGGGGGQAEPMPSGIDMQGPVNTPPPTMGESITSARTAIENPYTPTATASYPADESREEIPGTPAKNKQNTGMIIGVVVLVVVVVIVAIVALRKKK